ncbi:MAG: OmpA family protein [Planctomycetaceae bacterium]|nr:OmpA family protein [Planctomycetaceae bacterium]
MAGKGGGAWKVAYADFVTAMMAFFLVMWIVAQNKPVKEAIAGYFRDPYGSGLTPGGSGFLEGGAPRSRGGDKKKGASRAPSLAMIQTAKGTSVGAYVMFDENSIALDQAAKDRLKDILPLLMGKKTKIELRAHVIRQTAEETDPEKLWKLCYDRSIAVMKNLEAAGIDHDRFRLSQAGPFEPQVTAQDPLWRRRNSRVDIIMLNEYVDDYNTNDKRKNDVHGHGDDDHGHDAPQTVVAPRDAHGKAGAHAPAHDDHGDSHAKESHVPAKPAGKSDHH